MLITACGIQTDPHTPNDFSSLWKSWVDSGATAIHLYQVSTPGNAVSTPATVTVYPDVNPAGQTVLAVPGAARLYGFLGQGIEPERL